MTFTPQPFPMAAFEDGMLWRVRKANEATVTVDDVTSPLLGYVLRQVENYSGQLEGGPETVAQFIRDLPAVWACFEDAVWNEGTGLFDASFTVACVATNARNEKAARRGAGAGEVGVYQIARDVAGVLDGFACDPSATALRCTKITVPFNAAFRDTRVAIALMTFTTHWDPAGFNSAAGDMPSTEVIGDFDTFDIAWEVPPFPAPEPAIPSSTVDPAAGTYDAEDTIDVNPGD